MSPQAFDKCVASKGSRVRTITLKNNRYMRICYLDGESHAGEVKESKGKK